MSVVKRAGLVLLLASANACRNAPAQESQGVDRRPANGKGQVPAFAGQTDVPEHKLGVAFDVVTVADGFERPWAVGFLPNGNILVTEKPGRLRIVSADGRKSEPVAGMPAVDARGQGGLLDVALDPDFATNGLIYWSYTEPQADGMNNTAVARGKLVEGVAPRVEDRPSGERDEAGRETVEFLDRQRSFALWSTHLHLRYESTKILVSVCG